ncbi:PREDICTED: DNA/RNA-binding protein KIN17 [Ceratosolen solmsi marchali]|uniref:DNA/RNA-binding protein KIN17 n=1 Tax=Ceratosolen solmsi marchali TaxID=326594 RepID=A0AAJ6YFA8_9HYME|nr:PREDICTED: DNA/RNA-binding protein KIN17 [Ceratosolen solmsi marchali]
MGKHEVGTPKYIANKIKAKGLQKLRWYCQMCQKQCRDENGFKCHTLSESHHRQLLLFADNANKYMDQFSKEFSHGYLNLLKRQFGTKRVPANRVYQEYIADRNHVHMNATMWLTLTAYVKWLGRSGKCVVDETEKGWFITYIDRDPETIAAQEKKMKKDKMDRDDQERMMDFINKQVRDGKSNSETTDELKPLERLGNNSPIVLDIKMKPKKLFLINSNLPINRCLNIKEIKLNNEVSTHKKSISSSEKDKSKLKRKVLLEIKKNLTKKGRYYSDNEDENDKNNSWLRVGLSVKIISKSHGEKYYNAKGVVQELKDLNKFVGKIKLKSPNNVKEDLIMIDQKCLETVIPSIGREVMVLWGKYSDKIAIIKNLRINDFCVDIELKNERKLLKKIPYEQVCKYIG